MRKVFPVLLLTTLLLVQRAGDIWAYNTSDLASYGYFSPVKKEASCSREQTLEAIHSCFLDPDQKVCLALATANCKVQDERVRKLEAYFAKHNSPLKPYAYEFVYYADVYQLDWKLVPAISGVESTFGKHIPFNSYNAYGWANGAYKFTSWENSIEHVTKTLREKYYDRGLTTVPKMSRVYCPPNPAWGLKVQYFMTQIESVQI